MKRRLAVATAVVLLLGACSNEPTMTEYAEEVETLVVTMNARLDALDAELGETQDLDEIKRYATERIEARRDFLAGLEELDPPTDAAQLHAAALDIMGRLAEAEATLADRVLVMETASGIDAIWDTPEGRAARAADDEAIALCQAAEAELDRDRAEFEGVPWIPTEMKEVVEVAFGCLTENR